MSQDSTSAHYDEVYSLVVATFLSIATIIGSGILGLPVTLHQTSLKTFLLFFTLNLAAQCGIVVATVDLLHRGSLRLQADSNYNDAHENEDKKEEVSMAVLARYFLPTTTLRAIFNAVFLFTLIVLLASYGLAGPQTVWHFLQTSSQDKAPKIVYFLYWLVGTGSALLLLDVLLRFLTGLTFVKGLLFVIVIFIVQLLPDYVKNSSPSSLMAPVYKYSEHSSSELMRAAAPFLMSSVALGGLPLTMSVSYNFLPRKPTAPQIRRYRNANLVALFVCYVINVCWIFAVLEVVPRKFLTNANIEGQISTTPLLLVLREKIETEFLRNFTDRTVGALVLCSTCVSFFILSIALKNYIDGIVSSVSLFDSINLDTETRRWLSYSICFGSVLIFVLLNPKSLLDAMTRYLSACNNMGSGVFVLVMLYFSRNPRYNTMAPNRTEEDETKLLSPVAAPNTKKETKVTDSVLDTRSISKATASALITTLIPFFLFATLLALLGPFFGVDLGAGE